MHAGDAIWYLHAELTMLERRYSADPSTLDLLAKMREAVRVIGEFVKVDPPPADKLQPLIESISSTILPVVETAPATSQPQSSGNRVSFSDPERIEAAKEILDEMISSELFDWAEIVENINEQVKRDNPFITDRQFRAIVNIGRKGDHGAFWERLSDECPTSVAIAEQAADRAG